MLRGSRRETTPPTDLSSKVTDQVVTIGDRLFELGSVLFAALVGAPPRIDELDYRSVVDFFITNKHAVPDHAVGALVRESTAGSGTVVHLVFLDEAGEPITDGDPAPPSRRYLVSSFDEELTELFGDSPLIVFS
jgi:hypothetical protein